MKGSFVSPSIIHICYKCLNQLNCFISGNFNSSCVAQCQSHKMENIRLWEKLMRQIRRSLAVLCNLSCLILQFQLKMNTYF